jgi:UTP--glucose-1-phosphate uridylyltransferase
MKAIIAVAGFGTRFLPVTKNLPKEMLPVVDKPVIHYLVEEAVDSGITDIIFITSAGKHALEDYFDRHFELEYLLAKRGKTEALKEVEKIHKLANFYFVRQKEPNGTGHAILQAENLIGNEPCLVMYGDDIVVSKKPCVKQLIDIYEKYKSPVVALERVPKKDVYLYGVVSGVNVNNDKRVYKIEGVVEKPSVEEAPSNLSIIGKYLVTPDLLRAIKKTKPNKKGEIGLSETLEWFVDENLVYGYEFEGVRYDCGSKIGLLKANIAFGLKHPETGLELKKFLKSIK